MILSRTCARRQYHVSTECLQAVKGALPAKGRACVRREMSGGVHGAYLVARCKVVPGPFGISSGPTQPCITRIGQMQGCVPANASASSPMLQGVTAIASLESGQKQK